MPETVVSSSSWGLTTILSSRGVRLNLAIPSSLPCSVASWGG
jgi:hypothetical protein